MSSINVYTAILLKIGYSEGGRDTCAGDSGGPLIAKMKDSGRYEQIGVTSWGYGRFLFLHELFIQELQ